MHHLKFVLASCVDSWTPKRHLFCVSNVSNVSNAVLSVSNKPVLTALRPFGLGKHCTGSQITRSSIDLSRASLPKTCICRCQRFLQQLRLEDLAATHHVDKLKKSEMSDEGGKNSGWENHQSEVRANDDKTRVLFRLQLSYQPHIGQSLMSSCLW